MTSDDHLAVAIILAVISVLALASAYAWRRLR